MYMIEKVAKTEFTKNVTYKPLKLNPRKNPRFPSPRVEHAPGQEGEIFEEGAVLGGFGIEPSHTQKIESGRTKDAGSKTPEVADSISTLRASRFGGHLSSPPKPSTRIQLSTGRQSLA
jgi:hypothetical protein